MEDDRVIDILKEDLIALRADKFDFKYQVKDKNVWLLIRSL